MTNIRIESHCLEDTEALARKLAERIPKGTVVALRGTLGAGKTAFAKAFAKALGINENVSSPTFTVAQEYKAPGGTRLYHLDLYRINDSAAALVFGVDEYFDDPAAITLVEWPERISELLPPNHVGVHIEIASQNSRTIQLSNIAMD